MQDHSLEFITFQQFGNRALARELADLFEKHQIEYVFHNASPNVDASFGGGVMREEYEIKIHPSSFKKADEILLQNAADNYDSIDKDYYLFGFTDEELRDVIITKDEWSAFDFLLAQKLLADRGKAIGADELELLRKQRWEALAKPEPRQTLTIFAGYLFAVVGVVLGFFIGWYLKTGKKTLPNGERVFSYSVADRKHGSRIMAIAILFLILGVLSRIYWDSIHRLLDHPNG